MPVKKPGRYSNMRILVTLLFGLFFLQACKREDTCLLPQGVQARAGFITKDSLENPIDSVLSASLLLFQAQDSIYAIPIFNSKSTSFRLSSKTDSTRYIFQSDTTTTNPATLDTLILFANRNPKFVSVACGFQYNFEFTQVTHTRQVIDSVWIINETVDDNVNTQHLRILLKKL